MNNHISLRILAVLDGWLFMSNVLECVKKIEAYVKHIVDVMWVEFFIVCAIVVKS